MTHLAEIKILIGPSSFAEMDKTPLNRLKNTGCCIIDNPYKRKLTKLELIKLVEDDVVGLIAGLEPLNREVMEKSQLKVISRCGSGMSNVDLEAANKLGIKVYSTPDAPVNAVAELTLGAMLSLLRMIPQMNSDLHEGKWTKKVGLELTDKTVAIIGFGRIGRRLARMLVPFKVTVLAVDPNLQGVVDNIHVMPLEDVLPQAEIITIHSVGEQCLIHNDQFALMRPGTFLLNAARGGMVDESALISAIEKGTIIGAWIDTFEEEPYTGPLTNYPQVILTPHVGSYTLECRRQMETEAAENLIAGLKRDRI